MAGVTDKEIDGGFMEVWNALDVREQRKAMRGALRKEATTVRRAAVTALGASGILKSKATKSRKNSATSIATLSKSIYQRVYPARYGLGFMVSVKTGKSGKKGFHTNRRGQQKPVLMWAAEGTKQRRVGKRTNRTSATSWTGKKYHTYKRGGHSTGKMPRYGFMDKAEAMTSQGVEARLWERFQGNLERAVSSL